MSKKRKKRLQVNVDPELAEQAQTILQELGLTTQVALTIFLKKVVAIKGIPFNIQMTEDQKNSLNLQDAISNLPVKELRTKQDVIDWFNDNPWHNGTFDDYDFAADVKKIGFKTGLE